MASCSSGSAHTCPQTGSGAVRQQRRSAEVPLPDQVDGPSLTLEKGSMDRTCMDGSGSRKLSRFESAVV